MPTASVYVGNIGLGAPYQIGEVERRGDMWKKIVAKVVETRSANRT